MNLDVLAAEITYHTVLGERTQHITVVLVFRKSQSVCEGVTQGQGVEMSHHPGTRDI